MSWLSEIESALEKLSIPREAVVVEIFPRFREDASLRDLVRPVVGGLQIQTPDRRECTLGYNVTRILTGGQQDSDWYFVIASHCTWTQFELTGHSVGQPAAANVIGYEVADPRTFDSSGDSNCPPGRQCRYSDAALLRYSTPLWTHGVIAWPPLESIYFSQTKIVSAHGASIPGLPVHKVGRTTGHTSGTIWYPCIDVLRLDGVWLICQDVASYDSGPGDSGSPVVYLQSDGTLVAWGVHWGVDTLGTHLRVFSRTVEWRNELGSAIGGTLHVTANWAPPPSVWIDGYTFLPPGLSCTWTAHATGGVPPYSHQWSGVFSGNDNPINGIVWSSGWLYVTVADAVGHTGVGSLYITIDPNAPGPPDCFE